MKAFVRIAGCVATVWGCAAVAEEDYRPSAQRATREDIEPLQVQSTKERDQADLGLYAQLGGGVEGYTGQLNPETGAGFAYGAAVGYRPMPYLAVELGYQGSINTLDVPGRSVNIDRGVDLVRNGGQALVLGNFTDARLQPYAVTGIGVDDYNVRHNSVGERFGYHDDTAGYVPAGLGLRYQVGKLVTADARVSYNFLFDQDFAPTAAKPDWMDGRYIATLQVGGTY
ncbi:hypothetical protein LZ198_27515 [Myxococcus sp. K15C18031901]|uniref:outer membrane protein n=1 Tax=Myxococcus dinghuensis TaxID=2906761 RepID=UPI0020A7C7FD|nr:hypothetical protein [Myxococcus dinghuensis]MCP3102629.1 hypothetical protein [Myxococcus dinghuensis]